MELSTLAVVAAVMELGTQLQATAAQES